MRRSCVLVARSLIRSPVLEYSFYCNFLWETIQNKPDYLWRPLRMNNVSCFLTPPVLKALIALVSCPEPEHPLRADLAEEYSKDRAKFMKNAEEYTKKHSEKRPVEWWHNTDAHSCLLSFWFLLKEPLSAPSPVYI